MNPKLLVVWGLLLAMSLAWSVVDPGAAIAFAALKFLLIAFVFMGLRRSHWVWRALSCAYAGLVVVLLLAVR